MFDFIEEQYQIPKRLVAKTPYGLDRLTLITLLEYRICPIKRTLRRGNDRVCVYLLVKNSNIIFHIKEFKLANCRGGKAGVII